MNWCRGYNDENGPITSMPCALAHSRTSMVFSPLAGALRALRTGRLALLPARRAALM